MRSQPPSALCVSLREKSSSKITNFLNNSMNYSQISLTLHHDDWNLRWDRKWKVGSEPYP